MANIRSFPNNQDEYIGAEHVMRWHHGRSSGVFGADGNAAVTAVLGTMAVAVSDGTGWIANENADGIVWWVDNEKETGSKLQLPVDMADAALPRIDRVIVSWQTTNYVALPEVKILKGVPASAPVAPELTNDGLERQISLAAITIPAGTTAITASMIADERLDDSVCGIVTDNVGVDTSVMHEQFAAFMEESIERQLEYIAQQQTSWDAFFENVASDTLVPVPTGDDAGKVIVVSADGNGYALGEAQTEIPITSEVPADSDIWIDPGENTPEAGHILDKNNPHKVTAEQIGAAKSNHTHSASDVVSGTLPVARGGTGAATAAAALVNLGALSNEGGTITGTLYVNNTTDASSTADKNPALILGNRDGEHIVFDGNEIIPKSGATSAGTLYLGDSASTVISVSGVFRLNSNTYGGSLPTAGTAGRVFFKKV